MKNPLAWLRVAATFLVELLKSTRDTLAVVYLSYRKVRPAVLAVPLDVRSDGGITLFADMVTLTPGTTSLHVSDDRKTLYVHCLNCSDREAMIRGLKETLERSAREVLP